MPEEFITYSNGNELADMIKDFKGYSQFTLVTITEPKCLKKSRTTGESYESLFKGKIYKKAIRYASLGFEYEKSVNNRLVKEGQKKDFESLPLPWGEWVEGSKTVITHKGVMYARISYLNANSPFGQAEFIFSDGVKIEGDKLEVLKTDFLPVKGKSNRQHLENEVIVNSIKCDNIMRVKMGGNTYLHKSLVGLYID